MPRIIVTAENGNKHPVLLDERVEPVHLDDAHRSVPLLERIVWALTDAKRAETRSRGTKPRVRKAQASTPGGNT
jgi:hypothetical protein